MAACDSLKINFYIQIFRPLFSFPPSLKGRVSSPACDRSCRPASSRFRFAEERRRLPPVLDVFGQRNGTEESKEQRRRLWRKCDGEGAIPAWCFRRGCGGEPWDSTIHPPGIYPVGSPVGASYSGIQTERRRASRNRGARDTPRRDPSLFVDGRSRASFLCRRRVASSSSRRPSHNPPVKEEEIFSEIDFWVIFSPTVAAW